jgi:hypothetical protein
LAASILGAIAALTLGGSASALGTHVFSVTMSGAEEVPMVVTGGTALCFVTLDDVTGMVSVSGTFSGLSSSATAAHIHGPAAVGMNAGVLVALSATAATSGTVSGSGTLSAANVTNMLSGLTYLNLHTSMHPAGEIRGQVLTEVPALTWPWAAGMVVLVLAGGAFLLARRSAPALA